MLCFDSDFIIDFLRGENAAIEKVKSLEKEGIELVTTAINSLEVFVGILVIDSPKNRRVIQTKEFLESLVVLPFDKDASEKADIIINSLKKKKKKNKTHIIKIKNK